MYITEISYENYRNIHKATLKPDAGINILCGDNAQGKTSALEGIYHFAIGKSFRGVIDREIILFGEQRASVSLKYRDANRENTVSMTFHEGKAKKMLKNGVPLKKTSEFIGNIHCVLFCPEHLMLIKGSPQLRRDFLDGAICQLKPSYEAALTVYQRILRQRNALLRDEFPQKNRPLLEVLTSQLAEVNSHITVTRRNYVKMLDEYAEKFLSEMTDGGEHAHLFYESDTLEHCAEKPDEISEKLFLTEQFYNRSLENLDRDMAARNTLNGSHRDDISVLINGREAKKYASQGQGRSLALAMKLGEGELSRRASGEYPVFLFDDVLSELDERRQRFLMKQIKDRQVILTACNADLFREAGTDVTMIYVEKGTFL